MKSRISLPFRAALPEPAEGAGSLPRYRHIVVSGATGFIGSHLQARLLARAERVTALLRPGRRPPVLKPGIERHSADLTRAEDWLAVLADADAVLHLAGSVRGAAPEDFAAANVDAAAALGAAVATLNRQPAVLLLSSLAASQPQLSDYAASKHQGEQALAAAGIACTVLRPPAVYGPGDTEMQGIWRAVRCGLAPRPGPVGQRIALLQVSDLVEAIDAWLHHPDRAAAVEPYAIDDGTPGGYTWHDIAAALAPRGRALQVGVPPGVLGTLGRVNLRLARLFNYAPMLTPGKARELCYPRWLCDNAPFSRATGWQPHLRLSPAALTAAPSADHEEAS